MVVVITTSVRPSWCPAAFKGGKATMILHSVLPINRSLNALPRLSRMTSKTLLKLMVHVQSLLV